MDQYWKWLEKTFIPNLFDTHYANGTEIDFWQDKACISDHETRRVGVARIRQLRIKNGESRVWPRCLLWATLILT